MENGGYLSIKVVVWPPDLACLQVCSFYGPAMNPALSVFGIPAFMLYQVEEGTQGRQLVTSASIAETPNPRSG
jgi:hypothetical protein